MILDSEKYNGTKGIHEFISKNTDRIIACKKAQIKKADEISAFMLHEEDIGNLSEIIKANKPIENPPDILPVKVAINTTRVYDSHGDVHIDGLWKKSLSENKFIAHIREHKWGLENIISDGNDLKAYTETIAFSKLGIRKYTGETQALIFESNVRKSRNEFMHNQYANGWIKQHSVGMQYVKLFACVDNKDYPAEFKNWKKYIDQVVNPEDIRDKYFFAVTEAKALEGSAVTRGSNHVTPTLDNNLEPGKSHSTTQEPSHDTQKVKNSIYLYL